MSKQDIKNKKGVTLDDLAGMVLRGFEAVDNRFDEMDRKLNAKMDLHFDILSDRIKDLSVRNNDGFHSLDRRVTRLEHKVNISK